MLLNRLKKYLSANANANSANFANVHHQNNRTLATLATLATLQLATPAESEVISNWWLIHFVDDEPLQVAIWPPCDHVCALGFHPTAIAAEPIQSPIEESDPCNPN